MKISIITITYNSSNTIQFTLDSVRQQTYTNIEHIIIDGASSDNTLEIVKMFPHVAKIVSEKDKGVYDAMNKGIRHSTGDIIGILNSDDLYQDANVIQAVMSYFEDITVDVVYANLSYFKTETPNKIERVWVSKPYYEDFFEDGEAPPHPTLFVRKKVYDTIGCYYPDFKIASDYEFMLRVLKQNKYKALHIDQTIVKMRLGGESTKGLHNLILNNKEVLKAWKMNNLTPPLKFYIKRPLKKILQLAKHA